MVQDYHRVAVRFLVSPEAVHAFLPVLVLARLFVVPDPGQAYETALLNCLDLRLLHDLAVLHQLEWPQISVSNVGFLLLGPLIDILLIHVAIFALFVDMTVLNTAD